MTLKRITNRQIPEFLATLTPFQANSTRGDWYNYIPNTGILPGDVRATFRRDIVDTLPVRVYVVHSYLTPIAWLVPGDGWTVPQVRYSRTTSNAQALVRRGIGCDDYRHLISDAS